MTIAQLVQQVCTLAGRGQITKPDGSIYSNNTIMSWSYTSPALGDLNTHGIDEIDKAFIRSVVSTLNQRGMSRNYIAALLKNIRSVVMAAARHDLIQAPKLGLSEYGIKVERIEKVYLTGEDVLAIETLDLSTDSKLEVVRDRWLLMYYTGLRISDADNLSSGHISGNRIRIMNKKTGSVVVIPMHPSLVSLIERYKGVPPALGKDVLNRGIKVVARMAGVSGEVVYRVTRGGLRVEVRKNRWEMVSCHSARRSITTNMIRAGITHDIAGDMLGMTPATWGVYNRLTSEEKATSLEGTGFFS